MCMFAMHEFDVPIGAYEAKLVLFVQHLFKLDQLLYKVLFQAQILPLAFWHTLSSFM
jgi:hypothetical protein